MLPILNKYYQPLSGRLNVILEEFPPPSATSIRDRNGSKERNYHQNVTNNNCMFIIERIIRIAS